MESDAARIRWAARVVTRNGCSGSSEVDSNLEAVVQATATPGKAAVHEWQVSGGPPKLDSVLIEPLQIGACSVTELVAGHGFSVVAARPV